MRHKCLWHSPNKNGHPVCLETEHEKTLSATLSHFEKLAYFSLYMMLGKGPIVELKGLMLNVKKWIFTSIFLLTLPLAARESINYGNPKLNTIAKIIQSKKVFKRSNSQAGKIGNIYYYQLGNKAYFIQSDGSLIEGPVRDIMGMIHVQDKRRRGQVAQPGQPQKPNSGQQPIDYGNSRENKIYDKLRRNPGRYFIDREAGKVYWIGKGGGLSSAPLALLPIVSALPFGPPQAPIGGNGNGVRPAAPKNEPPPGSNNNFIPKQPRQMMCNDDQGLKFTPRDKLISSSAQLDFPGGNCNSFRTSGHHLLTNAHCMKFMLSKATKRRCNRYQIIHRYIRKRGRVVGKEVEDTPRSRACVDAAMRAQRGKNLGGRVIAKFVVNGRSVRVRCKTMRAASQTLDYALLDCPGIPQSVPVAKLAKTKPRSGEKITLATWDFKGRRVSKRVRTGRVKVSPHSKGDTYKGSMIVIPGNSGSSMFNQKGEVTGLVNSSNWIPGRRRSTETTGFYSVVDILNDIEKQGRPDDAELIRRTSSGIQMACREEEISLDNLDASIATTVEH